MIRAGEPWAVRADDAAQKRAQTSPRRGRSSGFDERWQRRARLRRHAQRQHDNEPGRAGRPQSDVRRAYGVEERRAGSALDPDGQRAEQAGSNRGDLQISTRPRLETLEPAQPGAELADEPKKAPVRRSRRRGRRTPRRNALHFVLREKRRSRSRPVGSAWTTSRAPRSVSSNIAGRRSFSAWHRDQSHAENASSSENKPAAAASIARMRNSRYRSTDSARRYAATSYRSSSGALPRSAGHGADSQT